jgi:hypothetical protein
MDFFSVCHKILSHKFHRNTSRETFTKLYFIFLLPLQATASVVWWSEFLATDPEVRVRFPALPEKNK